MSGEEVEAEVLAAGNLYEVLGLTRSATEAEIQRAYKLRARFVHPDKNTSPTAIKAFQKLLHAKDCLTDPTKRYIYDSEGDKALDDYELRGDKGEFNLTVFIVAVAAHLAEIPNAVMTGTRRKRDSGESAPLSEAEEDYLGKVNRRCAWFLALLLFVGIGVTLLDLDQRSPVASFARGEGERYIFEQIVVPNSNYTASRIKYYTRWKASTLGETSIRILNDAIGGAAIAQCREQHTIAKALQLRQNQAPGYAKFKARRQRPRRHNWSWTSKSSTATFKVDSQCELKTKKRARV